MADVDELEPVTAADVRAAEQEADEAERLALTMLERVSAGVEDISPDTIEAQERVSRFARLRASGVKARRERFLVAERVRGMRELRKEVLTVAPKSGGALVAALRAVEDAAREFVQLANAHDAQINTWRERIEAFKIDWGTTEEGITNHGTVLVGGVKIEQVNANQKLVGIFSGSDNSVTVRPANDDRLLATYRSLDGIGEGL